MGSQIRVLANLSGSEGSPERVRKGWPIQPYIEGTVESSQLTHQGKGGDRTRTLQFRLRMEVLSSTVTFLAESIHKA